MTGVDWDVVVIGRSFGGLSAVLTRGRRGSRRRRVSGHIRR